MQSGWVASPVFPCQVRCAGCSGVLNVPPGCAEFRCPRCKLPQVLPPELMQHATLKPPGQGSVAQGVDPSKVQLPCAHCKSLLNVPHGLTRFNCPQCKVELAVDHSKLQNYISALSSQPLPAPFITNLGSSSSDGSQPEHEVGTEIDREDDENGTVGETFMEYNPSNLALGTPHPDPVVETSSLSAIASPQLHYQLKIGKEIQKTQALSCLQIETIVLASQRHEQHLPDKMRAGFFMGDGAGVGKGRTIAGLIWENWHHGRCRAVWLSVSSDLQFDARRDLDDVGATCVKVHPLNKLPYSKLDSKAVGIMDGVIFSTYSSLIASSEKGQTRLKQLIQWCGQDSDCLLIFDECHKAKNLVPEAGSQATRTGEAVRDIQMKMPEARVVYCSATGASEPRNMAYMVRLGLWGDGTCFPKFENFLEALDKGGVGALELVAMDMKARGMYVCRTLSYKGAEFDVVDAPLEAEMKEMYHRATAFWAKFRLDLMSAIESYGEEQNHKFLWRLFWASQQRFFRHMCLSAKVPAVVRLSKQALQEDKCIVIGLQTTGEARTEEAVTKYGPELEDFVSGPRELLLKLVEEHYPLPQRPPELPGDGDLKELGRKRKQASRSHAVKGRMRKAARMKGSSNVESDYETESEIESAESDDDYQICDVCYNEDQPVGRLIECSCCGKPVHLGCMGLTEKEYDGKWTCMKCQERTNEYAESSRLYLAEMWKRFEAAKERKSQFLEAIRALDLPNNPLDDIIDQLGGAESVAEMTGRRGRLVRDASGKIVYQARNTKEVSMEMVNMHEKQLFMDGKKLVAVISEAGSAGLSLQADKRAKNQKRRVHITLELPWSADRAIQQFGRTHRSNQASAPQYRLLFSSLGGECRFASTVAKRLESLGALTQGDRRAGPSLSAYNFDSPYGKKALNMMYKAIMGQVELSVLPPGCSADEMERISTFHNVAKAALMTVGIVRDSISGPGSQLAKFSGRILDSDMNDVGRFLNRLLAIEPDVQNRIFEYFLSIFDYEINNARKEGNFDSGIVDIKANTIDLIDSPMIVYEDEMSKASTTLFKLKMDRGMSWEAAHRILEESSMDSRDDGFYESKRDWFHRKHFLLATEGSKSTTNRMLKIYRPANSFPRDMPLAELLDKYKKVSSLEIARKEWEKELERSAVQCMHGPNCKVGAICSIGKRILEIHVLGGLILPVWSKIEKALSMQVRQAHRRLRVVRLETSDDRRIVGVHIPNTAINSVLEDLKSSI